MPRQTIAAVTAELAARDEELNALRLANIELGKRVKDAEQTTASRRANKKGRRNPRKIADPTAKVAVQNVTKPKLTTTVTEAIAAKTDPNVWRTARLAETNGRPGAFIVAFEAAYPGAPVAVTYAAWRKFKLTFDSARVANEDGSMPKSLFGLTAENAAKHGTTAGKLAAKSGAAVAAPVAAVVSDDTDLAARYAQFLAWQASLPVAV